MKTAMIAGAALATICLASPALAATDAEVCKYMTDTLADFNGDGPHMVDDVTRAEKSVLDCAKKTADFKWTILVAAAKLNKGWQDTIKGNWLKVYCGEEALVEVLKSGWKVSANWVTTDNVAYRAETTCP